MDQRKAMIDQQFAEAKERQDNAKALQEQYEGALKSAKEESTQIREGARDYADELLENTQVNLSEIIKMLNENRQELRG